jgi:hypothetical protein
MLDMVAMISAFVAGELGDVVVSKSCVGVVVVGVVVVVVEGNPLGMLLPHIISKNGSAPH